MWSPLGIYSTVVKLDLEVEIFEVSQGSTTLISIVTYKIVIPLDVY